MKKIIAAALSLLVGAFGYTIVDKTLEQRVTDLEYSVSSLEELHNTSETYTEYETTVTTTSLYDLKTYHYGYLKIKLPDLGIYATLADDAGNDAYPHYSYCFDTNQEYYLNGSEITVLVRTKKNSSGLFRLLLEKDNTAFDFFECKITERNSEMSVSDIQYFEAPGLTTTTTTTTTVIHEITTR